MPRWSLFVLVAALGACAAPDDGAPAGPHLFGSHGQARPADMLLPSVGTVAERDAATAAFYDAWKATYLLPGCTAGSYRVKTAPDTDAFTVSEGHGYGMLIAALMAGRAPDAQAIFDGLYAYYAAHPSAAHPPLMAWAQDQACADVDGPDSATDGDLDIAYALLLADRQWGSTGAVDYRGAAAALLTAILAAEIAPSDAILIGDWAADDLTYGDGTRPSDFMTGHLAAFQAATGEARWADVRDRAYALVDALQATAAPTTGLLPDFVVDAAGAAPQPAPPGWLEGDGDGRYGYNACRVPWRLAADYLTTGEPRARAAVRRIDAWAQVAAAGDPAALRDGYQLDGTVVGTSPELPFVAPLAVGAMLAPPSPAAQAWLDALWTDLVTREVSAYYGDSLKLLAMIALSDNWWAP